MHPTTSKAGSNLHKHTGLLLLVVALGLALGNFGDTRAVRAADRPATAPAPAAGPGGKVSIYGCTAEDVHRVILMVDTSGSMIGALGDVKSNLKKAVQSLPSDDGKSVEFDIITFSDEKDPRIFSKSVTGKQQLMIDNTENVKKAIEFIDDTVASGGTLPMPAIKAALAPDPPADTIFLMTDGFDNVASFDDVIETFKKATNDGKTKVNCIHFVAEPDPKLVQALTDIAKNGNGVFKQIQKSDMQ